MADPIKLGASGKRVPDLQQGINRILDRRDFDWRKIRVDGEAGASTFGAAHLALWLMGGSEDQLRRIQKGTITDHAFKLLAGRIARSDAMKRRDRGRRPAASKLREAHRVSQQVDAAGTAIFDDPKQPSPIRVAAWIVGAKVGPDGRRVNWLARARSEGWDGYLTSGFRDPIYSEGLCYSMCGAPSCPGRCAGRSSNHSQVGPPNWGAIDATDYANLGAIFARIGAPLRNSLGAQDPVHYSYTGN